MSGKVHISSEKAGCKIYVWHDAIFVEKWGNIFIYKSGMIHVQRRRQEVRRINIFPKPSPG